MRARRAALAIALAVALSACVASEAPPVVAAADGAAVGGEVRVGINRPGAVDPANAYDPAAELIARTMCDTLLTTDPATGELAPGLAESWLVTDDGQQVVVRLRRDLRFTDGEPVTARDVVASLSRAASPELAGELADLLQPIAGWDQLRGIVETDIARQRRELAGVSAVGEHAVQITLRGPDADFITVLTHPVTAPVSTTAVQADPEGFRARPVCVGPYELTEPWNANADVVTLVRSDTYGGAAPTATRDGAGWADRIVFRVTDEAPTPTRSADDASGTDPGGPEADPATPAAPVVAPPSLRGLDVASVAPAFWADLDAEAAVSVLTVAGPGVDLVGLPVPASEDTQARAVRAALSLALDRQAVADAIGGRAPATGFLPPTVGPGYRDGACPTTPVSADPGAAAAALRSAGAEVGSLRLVTTDEFRNRELAQAVAAQWEEHLGVAVEIEVVDWVTLQQRTGGVSGLDAAFRTSWSSPVPSAVAFLDAIAHSSRIGTSNWSRFSDPVTDELLDDEVRTSLDREDLLLELARTEDHLCQQLPLIPVVREVRGWAVRDTTIRSARADGLVLDRATALPRLRDLYARS